MQDNPLTNCVRFRMEGSAPSQGIFQSPWKTGPDNCRDIKSRNGQSFTLVREIWGDELLKARGEDTCPLALIRFGDGVEILAFEEEIGWKAR